jgi:hypothetical protein
MGWAAERVLVERREAGGAVPSLLGRQVGGMGEALEAVGRQLTKEMTQQAVEEILGETLYKDAGTGLRIHEVTIYETPNCWTRCTVDSVSDRERQNFREVRGTEISEYALSKGVVEYDDRRIVNNFLV